MANTVGRTVPVLAASRSNAVSISTAPASRQAAAAFGPAGHVTDLASPATPEAVYWALDAARRARVSPEVAAD